MSSPPLASGSGARRRSWSSRPGWWLIVLAALALVFLALPVVALVVRALGSGALVDALSGRAVLDALVLSLTSTGVSLLIVIVLGTPLAFVLARTAFRGKALAEALVDLPIVLPPSVAGLALLFAFGRNGLAGGALDVLGLNLPFTTLAVIVAQVFVASPFYIRATRAGFRGVEPEVEEAARVDGASENTVLGRITLPLAFPAIGAGLVLAWARALGEFGATILFAGNIESRTQTLPLLVYSEFQESVDAAIAAATILVVAALGVLIAVRLMRWPAGASPFS
ncbi:MAG: ABC transporter permease [Candidatus Limnocylindrales bacterium]